LPRAGSTLTNAAATDHLYVMPSSYTTNDALVVDASSTGTLTFATPAAYSALSFLTAAGNGSTPVSYTVHYSDGTTQTGTFTSPDWFNNTPVAYTVGGRASVETGSPDSIGTDNPRLYAADVALNNSTSPVTSVDLTADPSATGHAVIFAVSGASGSVKPIIDVQPTSASAFSAARRR